MLECGSMLPKINRTICLSVIYVIPAMVMSSCSAFSPTINPGEVIFQDDFTRSDSGWDRYSDSNYTADYRDGAYIIKVEGTNMTAWSLPNIDLENVLIRVEGLHIEGPIDNVYGVICRYVDPANFLFFMIASDGYAGIGKYAGGQKELLNHETLLPTDAIAPIDEVNLIQAACIDNNLTLWINGEIVAEATATEPTHGDVGLIVGTYDEGGVAIQFDNFSTLMP